MNGSGNLESARTAFARRQWESSCRLYRLADGEGGLSSADLESWATAAHLCGRREEGLGLLERNFRNLTDDHQRAAKTAFMLGFNLLESGEVSRGSAWLSRARKLLEAGPDDDGPVRGYLLLPHVQQLLGNQRFDEAFEVAGTAVSIAERCGERDLSVFARHAQGIARLRQGRLAEGLDLLDEAMLAALSDEISPIWMGILYCSAISGCRGVGAMNRMSEWTSRLEDWCSGQPQMLSFRGECRLHRAELLQLRGDWDGALAHARAALTSQATTAAAAALAWYQLGEVERLRGNHEAAQESYLEAFGRGLDPQPGLALLRFARGEGEVASNALARAELEARTPYSRGRVLSAIVNLELARGQLERAERAGERLASLVAAFASGPAATSSETAFMEALAHEARGRVGLAHGDWQEALEYLRRAREGYRGLDFTFECACVSAMIGIACRGLDDEETFLLEAGAARRVFAALGARPALVELEKLLESHGDEGVPRFGGGIAASARAGPGAGGAGATAPPGTRRPDSLTGREREVLSLVAQGYTNGAIGRELGISPRTVDRHLSNIFDRLGVNSRAAAVARATANEMLSPDRTSDG